MESKQEAKAVVVKDMYMKSLPSCDKRHPDHSPQYEPDEDILQVEDDDLVRIGRLYASTLLNKATKVDPLKKAFDSWSYRHPHHILFMCRTSRRDTSVMVFKACNLPNAALPNAPIESWIDSVTDVRDMTTEWIRLMGVQFTQAYPSCTDHKDAEEEEHTCFHCGFVLQPPWLGKDDERPIENIHRNLTANVRLYKRVIFGTVTCSPRVQTCSQWTLRSWKHRLSTILLKPHPWQFVSLLSSLSSPLPITTTTSLKDTLKR